MLPLSLILAAAWPCYADRHCHRHTTYQVDSKKELEKQLKAVCEAVIMALTKVEQASRLLGSSFGAGLAAADLKSLSMGKNPWPYKLAWNNGLSMSWPVVWSDYCSGPSHQLTPELCLPVL